MRAPALSFLLLALLPIGLGAQTARPLGVFHDLVGEWDGTAWYDMGPSGRQQLRQQEWIVPAAGGTVITVKGLGTMAMPDGSTRTMHDAFAVVHRDQNGRGAMMRAFTAEGRWMDMDLTIRDDGYTWGMTDPRAGRIRYEMHFDAEGRWVERGFRQQGEEWIQFLEMTLARRAPR